MGQTGRSRRWVLKHGIGALGAGFALPVVAACTATEPVSLPFSRDLGGAALEAILRGSFIPAVDEHTQELGERWAAGRNAQISLNLAANWRELGERTGRARRGADLAELFGNSPHVQSERLVDVTDLAERLGAAHGGWSEVARSACVVDGVWRAVPWSETRHGLVTRTDVLDSVGVALPNTYDDLLEVGTRLRDAGAPPLGLTMSSDGPNDSAALAYSVLWSFGGSEVDETGRVALDSAATRHALEYFAQLAELNAPDAIDFDEVGNNEAFLAGDVSVTQNASSIYWRATEVDLTLASSIEHVRFPEGPAGRFLLPEINSLAVFRHSEELTAALDWIEFVTEADVMIERARVSQAFHVPAAQALDDDPAMPWVGNPRLAALAGSAVEGRWPGWPNPPSIEAGLVFQNGSIVKMFRAVAEDGLSPHEAVKGATEELRRVYET